MGRVLLVEGLLRPESANPRKAYQTVRRTGPKCHMETFALQDVRKDSPQMLLSAVWKMFLKSFGNSRRIPEVASKTHK